MQVRCEVAPLSEKRIVRTLYFARPGHVVEFAVHRCEYAPFSMFYHTKLTCLHVLLDERRLGVSIPILTLNGSTLIGCDYLRRLDSDAVELLRQEAEKQGVRLLTEQEGLQSVGHESKYVFNNRTWTTLT